MKCNRENAVCCGASGNELLGAIGVKRNTRFHIYLLYAYDTTCTLYTPSQADIILVMKQGNVTTCCLTINSGITWEHFYGSIRQSLWVEPTITAYFVNQTVF